MNSFTITRSFYFEAAHHLPKHQGKCKNLHGHRWKVTVCVFACQDPTTGIAWDFGHMKDCIEPLINHYDHTNLNSFLENPTAENLALHLHPVIKKNLPNNISLNYITIQEGRDTEVAYYG